MGYDSQLVGMQSERGVSRGKCLGWNVWGNCPVGDNVWGTV